MPPKTPPPLPRNAPFAAHKKHADDFLTIEDFKDPKKVNLLTYRDMTDPVPEEPPEDRPVGPSPNRRVAL
jgi:hypothetical protein